MNELVALLLILHAADGHDVRIFPGEITALHSPGSPRGSHYPDKANCLVNLADGKFVAVIETCAEVEERISHMYEETR